MVVADLNEERGETVAKQIERRRRHGGRSRTSTSPIPTRRRPLAEFTVEKFGGIDHLVNNAAIYGGMKLDLLLTVPGTTTRSSWA